MSFHVGQKVICVDDSPNPHCEDVLPNRPVKGAFYTVRSLHVEPHITNAYGVRLHELINPEFNFDGGPAYEWSFNSARFRPVVERKTDISAFTAMLDEQKASEPV